MAAEDPRIKIGINEGEGTFYGPKFEYTLKDAIGRDWQLGTTQVDFNLPERFGAFYVDKDGDKVQPVMVHRAICGSLERFLGILIESYAGHFPLWLAPTQVVVATITQDADEYARKSMRRFWPMASMSNSTSQREDQLQGARALAAEGAGDPGGGNREAEEQTVNVRRQPRSGSMTLADAIAMAEEATPPDVLRKKAEKASRAA
jgi:threonyl-tRNA synthetase